MSKSISISTGGKTVEHKMEQLGSAGVSGWSPTDTDLERIASMIGGELGKSRVADVTLKASKWVGSESPYSQVVNITGITRNSQVNLTPSAEQLVIFYEKDLGFVTENVNGTVTVYAIGQKPLNDYVIKATIVEVRV